MKNGHILPYSFLVNLIVTFMSGLKFLRAINGQILPAAGYNTYRSWLTDQRKDKVLFPDNHIFRNYQIKSDHNRSPNIIRAVINFPLYWK